MQPYARARLLFIVGVFVPILLIPNVVLHCRSPDPSLRKWARYRSFSLFPPLSVGVCERERDRERRRDREKERERAHVCVCMCVCVREREKLCVCARVCGCSVEKPNR